MNPPTCTKEQADEALYARMELNGMERWETDVAAKQGDFLRVWTDGGAIWYYNDEQVLVWDEAEQKFTNVGEISVHLQHFK